MEISYDVLREMINGCPEDQRADAGWTCPPDDWASIRKLGLSDDQLVAASSNVGVEELRLMGFPVRVDIDCKGIKFGPFE